MGEKIRVMVIDDSAVVRQTLTEIINSNRDLQVIAAASDPYAAVKKIKTEVPDVITLDVEMPRMDGLTFLRRIMSQHPIPVVMVSSLTEKGSETALKAMEYGAVDIVTKPKMGIKGFLEESQITICDAVRAASRAKIGRISGFRSVEPKYSADAVLSRAKTKAMLKTTEKVAVVGASTGGTEALRVFLESLPHNSPGIAVVQHMPEHFTRAFANRLNTLCKVTVKEAERGDSLIRGAVLIAPGNHHMLLKRSGARYYVDIQEGPLVNRHRPSVDVLFRSAARYAGKNAVAIIMTGMGDDGARGMEEMKEAGAATIAQDESTCVVFGMPKAAIERRCVDRVEKLPNISAALFEML